MAADSQKKIALEKARLLVVDDEPAIGRALRRALASEYEITVETSARDAFARIESGERFDVILADLMMPDMTGMELHAAVDRVSPDQANRMIFMTGTSFERSAAAFLEGMVGRWIDKPFERNALRVLLRRVATP